MKKMIMWLIIIMLLPIVSVAETDNAEIKGETTIIFYTEPGEYDEMNDEAPQGEKAGTTQDLSNPIIFLEEPEETKAVNEETEINMDETKPNQEETEENREITKANRNETKTNPKETETNRKITEENRDETKPNLGETETNQDITEKNLDETKQNPEKTEENRETTESIQKKTETNLEESAENQGQGEAQAEEPEITEYQETDPAISEEKEENEEKKGKMTQEATPTNLYPAKRKRVKALDEEDFAFMYGDVMAKNGEAPENLIHEIEKRDKRKVNAENVNNNIYVTSDNAYNGNELIVQSFIDENGDEKTNAISVIARDHIKTHRNIKVGDSVSDVKRAYGIFYKQYKGMIIYRWQKDEETAEYLYFEYDTRTNKIVSITYIEQKN